MHSIVTSPGKAWPDRYAVRLGHATLSWLTAHAHQLAKMVTLLMQFLVWIIKGSSNTISTKTACIPQLT